MKVVGEPSQAIFQLGMVKDGNCNAVDNLPQECRSSWYLSKREIENNSPSRKDGVDLRKESQLRVLYCSFLQDIGIRLGVPQMTIATALMFCHRFYLHQSHAKNEWQTIATVSMFLASKVEDTPCLLDKVVIVAYETMYKRDPAASRRIHQKDIFERQKALILIGERVLLSTIRFDFNIQHPYKPLLEALKKFGITQKDVRQVAWNFVNDWLRTTLCLQYKPHYIAAGSLYLAAKLHNVKLPSGGGYVWWHEFDVTPHQLDAAVQQMVELSGFKKRPVVTRAPEKPKATETPPEVKEEASSPDSCVLSRPESSRSSSSHDLDGEVGVAKPKDSLDHNSSSCNSDAEPQCEVRGSENPDGVIEDGGGISKCLDQTRSEPGNQIDMIRIKALLVKMRKREREINKRMEALHDSSEDAWIERELEVGMELAAESTNKKQRLDEALYRF